MTLSIRPLPARAKRTQRIGQEPDARTPMLLDLAKRAERLAITERLASSPEYVQVANAAHAINSYTETASPNMDNYGEPRLSFFLYLSNLNRWDDPKYLDAINALETACPRLVPERKDTEDKDRLYRSHKWTWAFETGNAEMPVAHITVSLDAYEDAKTAECRRVQVGTRTIEEPIYRYDCVAPEGTAGELPAPVIALEGLV